MRNSDNVIQISHMIKRPDNASNIDTPTSSCMGVTPIANGVQLMNQRSRLNTINPQMYLKIKGKESLEGMFELLARIKMFNKDKMKNGNGSKREIKSQIRPEMEFLPLNLSQMKNFIYVQKTGTRDTSNFSQQVSKQCDTVFEIPKTNEIINLKNNLLPEKSLFKTNQRIIFV